MEVRREGPLGRKAPDDEAVVGLDPGGDPVPAVLDDPLETARPHPGPELPVGEELHQRLSDRPRVARGDQERLLAALDDPLVAVDVGADDRRPRRHRLEEDDPE